MFIIDQMSRTPVYEQLISKAERYILSGILPPGGQLPSVRSLSIELTVNPNTVQKAYSELDSRGIVSSVPGRGCFVAPDAREKLYARGRERLPELRTLTAALYLAGVPRDELRGEVDRACDIASRGDLSAFEAQAHTAPADPTAKTETEDTEK